MKIFEKIKNKHQRIFKFCGKKIFSYHKSLSAKELTKKLEETNNLLKQARKELKDIKKELKNSKSEIKKNKENIKSSAKRKTIKIVTSLNPGLLTIDEKMRYFSQRFYKRVGYYPDFKHPKSFNEKLNWIRFNYRNKEKKEIIDKFSFKKYIEEKLGPGYTIKLLKVVDNVEDLNFEGLPDKFVIKTTFGFGAKAVKVITDKNEADLDKIKYELSEKLNPWEQATGHIFLKDNQLIQKIIIEEYEEQADGQLYDYKFLCFHGEPKMIIAICDRKGDKYSISYYDTDWNKLDLKYRDYENKDIEPPKNFDKMIEIARILSSNFPFVRVDLYNIDGRILAGEMTFIPAGAMSKFEPPEWDYKMGEWLDLSKINPEHLRILPEFAEAAKTFIDPEIVESHISVRESK